MIKLKVLKSKEGYGLVLGCYLLHQVEVEVEVEDDLGV